MQEVSRTREEQLGEEEEAQEGGTSTGKKQADIRILPPANRCQNTAHEGALNKNNHKTQTHKLALKTYTASQTLNVTILVEL